MSLARRSSAAPANGAAELGGGAAQARRRLSSSNRVERPTRRRAADPAASSGAAEDGGDAKRRCRRRWRRRRVADLGRLPERPYSGEPHAVAAPSPASLRRAPHPERPYSDEPPFSPSLAFLFLAEVLFFLTKVAEVRLARVAKLGHAKLGWERSPLPSLLHASDLPTWLYIATRLVLAL
uniref:Uncharacterized protein n=1 Tax=Oryza nivara TaxID=4536 RepID=A0A0E0IEA8_ORYNI